VDALDRGGALVVAHVHVALGFDDLHPVDVVADLARLDRIARRGGFGARLAARVRDRRCRRGLSSSSSSCAAMAASSARSASRSATGIW
jgi:hypothetical protein